MKHVIFLFFLSALSLRSPAQPGRRGERVEAAKIGFISSRLNLTPDQAERFWPVYNRYEEDARALRRKAIAAVRESRNAGASESQSRQAIEDNLELQEERVELKRKYKDQFLRVISAQQLVALYEAEREFHKLLLQRLREERGKRER